MDYDTELNRQHYRNVRAQEGAKDAANSVLNDAAESLREGEPESQEELRESGTLLRDIATKVQPVNIKINTKKPGTSTKPNLN